VTGSADEPALADVQREFPEWVCWKGTNGLVYARPKDTLPNSGSTVWGEDARDLRDQIIRAQSRNNGQA
jgi:hypothetical protein